MMIQLKLMQKFLLLVVDSLKAAGLKEFLGGNRSCPDFYKGLNWKNAALTPKHEEELREMNC